jgi:hypothetical protein
VVLHSPITSRPFQGRDAAVELFGVLFDVLGEFEVTAELSNGQDGSHVFFWRALAGGKAIEGVDLIRHDAQGSICEVRVWIRPLASLVAFAAAIGPPEHDLELLGRPRVRRGAASLQRLAKAIEDELGQGQEQGALRLLFGFSDDFRGSSRPGRIALLRDEPPHTGDKRFDAALAGTAEFFAREASISTPRWVEGPDRFVEPWWFVSSRPTFDAYTLAHTPAVFARHGVFIAREVFDRA